MIFSTTEIMNYMRCRRQWSYSSFNQQSLTPIVGKPHFALGSAVHEALANWLNEPSAQLPELYNVAAAHLLEQAITSYRARIGVNPSPAELNDTYENLNLGAAMMRNYQEYYKEPLNSKITQFISSEQTVIVQIPGSPHQLECQFDGVAKRVSDGFFIIPEHKTYNSRPRQSTLDASFQFTSYIWAANQTLGSTAGLAYDGMWKRSAPPKGKKFEDLFLRTLVTRTQAELDEFAISLIAITTEMSNNPAIYKNVPWNGCWDCNYVRLCNAQSRSTNFELVKQEYYTIRTRTAAYEEEEAVEVG